MSGTVTAPQLFNAYMDRLEKASSGLWYLRACQILPTVNVEDIKVVMLGQSKGFTPWDAGTTPTDEQLAQYDVVASFKDYEDGFPIPLRQLNSNPELWMARARKAGTEAAESIQRLVAKHFIANKTGLDKTALISSSHAIGNQGNQTNSLTASEVSALNVSTAATPTTEEAIAIILGVWNYMKMWKGENGREVNVGMNSLTIVVNTGDHFTAFTNAITQAVLAAGTTNTLVGMIAGGELDVKVYLDPAMTGSNKVRFFNSTEGNRALALGMDGPTDNSIMEPGSEYARRHNAVRFSLKAGMAVASGWWANVAEATLS